MINKGRREAKYRLALSTAICANHVDVFRALLHADRARLDTRLAEFLLEEAGWPVEDFMRSVIDGELDG